MNMDVTPGRRRTSHGVAENGTHGQAQDSDDLLLAGGHQVIRPAASPPEPRRLGCQLSVGPDSLAGRWQSLRLTVNEWQAWKAFNLKLSVSSS